MLNQISNDENLVYKIIPIGISLISLILSAYSIIWIQRKKYKVKIEINSIEYDNGNYRVEFSIYNLGDKIVTIKKVLLRTENSNINSSIMVYNFSPSNIISIESDKPTVLVGYCKGDCRIKRFIEVKTISGKTVKHPFVLDQNYSFEWLSFMRFLLNRELEQFWVEISYSILPGAIVMETDKVINKRINLIDKLYPENKIILKGHVPILYDEAIATFTIDNDRYNNIKSIKKIAKLFPNIFNLIENVDRKSLDLFYTKEACEKYASDSGGQEYFKMYGFDPRLNHLLEDIYCIKPSKIDIDQLLRDTFTTDE